MRKMEKQEDVMYVESTDTHTVVQTPIEPDLPPSIQSKISTESCENTRWHTDICTQGASTTSCKIFQTLYLCQMA